MLNKVLFWKSIIFTFLLLLTSYLTYITEFRWSGFSLGIALVFINPFNRYSKLNNFEKIITIGSTLIYLIILIRSIILG